jgi:hypothetical protein
MQFPQDLVAMLSAFEKGAVRYLVIGGHAVGLHARPRSTKDLDIWLDAARANIDRACTALATFGVPPGIVAALHSAKPDEIVWMGRIPARVDFLLSIPGVEFAPSWRRRVQVVLEGVSVSVIGREDLLANKRAVGRPQDLRDARAIERSAAATPRAARKPRS